MSFRIPFTLLFDKSVKEVIGLIHQAPRKAIKDLMLLDLIFEDDKPTTIWNGVYIFFQKNGQCLYIGKNGSQNFIERILSHFALHENAYFNHILKRTQDKLNLPTLSDAALIAQDYELLLIPVEHWEEISPLEDLLGVFLKPELNPASQTKRKKIMELDSSLPLNELVKMI